ncbi:acyl carrier protein [Corynebacterium glaucum]|uniref:acyl carrier protein n=1 Tax=Corynebacterium glaucum TaxID=187491 RepID=UPI0025B5C4A5|nr:phosphopantetheine-binding protein [Corynebacterium glaucum]WJZ08245.1 acyl carrier protein [Corynebacterium glaucum]
MELSERLGLDKIELVQEDTGSRLLSLIDDHFNANLSPETLLTDSALSSLDRIELAIRIEEEFGVRIDERVYDKCATVSELAEYLEENSEEA